jgi:hypothetical protein
MLGYLLGDFSTNASGHPGFRIGCFQEESCQIKDKTLLVKSGVILAIVVVLFFLQAIPIDSHHMMNISKKYFLLCLNLWVLKSWLQYLMCSTLLLYSAWGSML